MKPYGVILFHTTSAAMRAKKVLTGAGLSGKLIPTPRQFSSDCGIAWRFNWNEADQVRTVLDEARVEIAALHPL